jgi:hypothetical protein
MKIIGKFALSLVLPTLVTLNVYGEETATTATKEGPTTRVITITETVTCKYPPRCPPDPAVCCKEPTQEEEPAIQESPTEETSQEGATTQKITIEKVITEKTTTTYICPASQSCCPSRNPCGCKNCSLPLPKSPAKE